MNISNYQRQRTVLHVPELRNVDWREILLEALAIALSVSLAVLVSFDNSAGMVFPAVVGATCLLMSAPFRFVFIIVGGMVVLQSSQELDATKLAYFAGAALAFGAALINYCVLATKERDKTAQLILMLTLSLLVTIVSLVVAMRNGTVLNAWLRDVAPYCLLLTVPIFARDISISEGSQKRLIAFFVTIGVLGCLSFLVSWLSRRGIEAVAIDRLLLPTPWLPAALLCLSTARALSDKKSNLWWYLLMVIAPGSILLTATRSAVVLLVGPAIIALSFRNDLPKTLGRFLCFGLIALVVVVGFVVTTKSNEQSQAIVTRLGSIVIIAKEPGADPSFIERRAETVAAWELFKGHMAFGTGPGYPIIWYSDWRTSHEFFVDSSLSFLSKFGLLGAGVLLAWVFMLRSMVGRLGGSGLNPAKHALLGFVAVTVVNLPLSNPLEDKGFAFALLLLLSLLFTSSADRKPAPERDESAVELAAKGVN